MSAVALTATLGAAAAGWIVSIHQMSGMDMGIATGVGSLAFFIPLWVWMMAAMMLPGAAPAVLRRGHEQGVLAVPFFVASYLGVWTLVGLAVYAAYGSHGTTVAGAITIAAGVYELMPLKRRFRRHCREIVRTGFEFGAYCVGSSIGLMLMFVILGVMSIKWMAAIAAVVTMQKLLPPRAVVDVPLALSIVGLGIVTIAAPSWIPGLMSGM